GQRRQRPVFLRRSRTRRTHLHRLRRRRHVPDGGETEQGRAFGRNGAGRGWSSYRNSVSRMQVTRIPLFVLIAVMIAAPRNITAAPTEQLPVGRVELMPNNPEPFKAKDWRAIARGFDRLAFDFQARGQYLPLIWWDDSRININSAG